MDTSNDSVSTFIRSYGREMGQLVDHLRTRASCADRLTTEHSLGYGGAILWMATTFQRPTLAFDTRVTITFVDKTEGEIPNLFLINPGLFAQLKVVMNESGYQLEGKASENNKLTFVVRPG
jgi:hypothetical protein